ncbi:MAG: GAF domain-containing protein [Chloroflexi bacterium]|nr:GAF domain-containing protein [Chloroflexota bacterium]
MAKPIGPSEKELFISFFVAILGALFLAFNQGILESALFFVGLYVPSALITLNTAEKKSQGSPIKPPPKNKNNGVRTLIEHAPEAIVVYDANTGKFADANGNAQRLFNYELHELLNLGPVDLSPHTQPSGVSSKRLAREKIKEALKGETPIFEWTHQNRRGDMIPCEIRLVQLPANGRQLIRASIVDLTRHKKYENELQKHTIAENQRTEELAGLALAGASISSSLDLDKVLEVVSKQLTNLLDVQVCIISDWGKNGNGLSPRTSFISRSQPPPRNFTPQTLIGEIAPNEALKESRPIQLRSDDESLSKAKRSAMSKAGVNTYLLLPLISHSKTIGLVELLDTRKPRRISEHELYLAQTLCQQAAVAIENARLFQSTRRQLDELTALKEIATACTEATNEDDLILRATEIIRGNLYPDNFGVLLIAENGSELFIHPSYDSAEKIKRERIPLGQGVTGRVAENGKALRIADTSQEDNYLGYDSETHSELCVPMKIGDRVIGVINAESREIDHFNEADENLLATFAGQLASGIERLRREVAERRKTAQLRVLNELTGEMSGILERQKLFDIVAERLHDHMEYYNACVFSVDEETATMTLESVRGAFKSLLPLEGYRQSIHKGLLGLSARSGELVLSNDVSRDPVFLEVPGMEEIRSELVVPIKIYKKVVALLNVDYDRANAFNADEAAALGTLADQISIALESISLFEATRRQLQELTVLHAIANAAVSAKSENELLERATEVIGATLYPDTFGFMMLEESGESLIPHPSYRGISESAKKLSMPLTQGISGQVAATGKPWRVSDVHKEPNYVEVNSGIRAELCVPIAGSQHILGVINAESAEVDAFTDADMRLLGTIAGQLGTAIEKLRLFESERRQREQAETLREVAASLGAASDSITVADLILEQLKRVVPYASASIQIIDGATLRMDAIAGNLDGDLLGERLNIDEDKIAHPAIFEQRTVLYEDISDHPDWLQLPGAQTVKSWICAPLVVRGECVGVLTVDGYEINQFTEADAQLVSSFANHAGIAMENARLFDEAQDSYTQTISALANAIDVRDSYTSGHSERLSELAVKTARKLNCSKKELEDVHWGALLHDIGKIGVPDQILSKPSALDPDEEKIMRMHPEIGARIIEPVKTLAGLAPIIRAHQEQYDGLGYPDGLKGEAIPQVARIISVADAYVAMTDDRVYRKALSSEEAEGELRRCAGTQFDPEVVEAFIAVLGERSG